MAANYTEHYELNQWEPADQVLRTDFNADNAKLDAALAQKAERAELEELDGRISAADTSIQQITADLTKITFGRYTGDGTEHRIISLGFTPQAVLLVTSFGSMYQTDTLNNYWGGLALAGAPVKAGEQMVLEIVQNGFRVYRTWDGDDYVRTNMEDDSYYYVAFA